MPISGLDILLIVVMIISAVLAMIRGFSREVLSIASWAAAAAAAYFYHPLLTPYITPYLTFTSNEVIHNVISGLVIFLVVLIITSYLTMVISDFIIDSKTGPLDRTLGFIFGAGRGVVLIVVALALFRMIAGEYTPDWIGKAKSYPTLAPWSDTLLQNIPDMNQAFDKGTPEQPQDTATEATPKTTIESIIEPTTENTNSAN